jgi:hypothetical protein
VRNATAITIVVLLLVIVGGTVLQLLQAGR